MKTIQIRLIDEQDGGIDRQWECNIADPKVANALFGQAVDAVAPLDSEVHHG